MAAYTRCLRCAGAPRRPASGSGLSLPFRPDMPSSLTPGSSHIACVQLRDGDAAFAEIRAARHSQHSRNPFHAGLAFRGFTGSHLLRPVRLLAPLDGSDRVSPATGGFYIQASDGSVTLPVAGYDYNSTGLLCWRDFHPQERQLASLHQIRRKLPDSGDKWHLDEVCLMIGGKKHWLWRAVDQDGVVLDVLVQSRRDKQAAKRLLRKLLKRQTRVPRVMITDKLTSYNAAKG